MKFGKEIKYLDKAKGASYNYREKLIFARTALLKW